MSDEPFIVFGSPIIGEEEIEAVTRTLRTSWIGTGPRVREFEEQIASYVGARHAVAVGSCTAALHLSMLASGVGPGDEVITTPLTFGATANAILHTGATPVFVDVDRATMNIDPALIPAAITERTKAIVPVHFAGRPCNMDAISQVASDARLMVIEDAAHALEAEYHGAKIGSLSPFTCFSFYVTKNITTGEGGMICTDDEETAHKLETWALHGLSRGAWKRFGDEGFRHYEVVLPGYKYNMTDIQASLGLVQLSRLEKWLEVREQLWAHYDDAFRDLPCHSLAPIEPNTRHARHLYTLLIDLENAPLTRDGLLDALHARGIGSGVHYRSLHLHQYYRERFGFAPNDFPNAHWISERTLSLPFSAKLTERDVERIVSAVRSCLS